MPPTLPESRLPQQREHEHGPGAFGNALGTISPNPWIAPAAVELGLRMMPGPLSPDREVVYVVVPSGRSGESFVDLLTEEKPLERTIPLPAYCVAARELRDVSGLSADAIGRLFPVARETVQRWMSGASEPSPHNLRRISALRSIFDDIHSLVGDVRECLLRPIPESSEGETIYDWLSQGRLSDVQSLVASLPNRRPYITYHSPDGDRIVRVTGAIHQSNEPSPETEYEDFD
jgi:hypothetical protein